MKKNLNISILPGVGIGKEISQEAMKIINWASKKFDLSIKLKEEYVGGYLLIYLEPHYLRKH